MKKGCSEQPFFIIFDVRISPVYAIPGVASKAKSFEVTVDLS